MVTFTPWGSFEHVSRDSDIGMPCGVVHGYLHSLGFILPLDMCAVGFCTGAISKTHQESSSNGRLGENNPHSQKRGPADVDQRGQLG